MAFIRDAIISGKAQWLQKGEEKLGKVRNKAMLKTVIYSNSLS